MSSEGNNVDVPDNAQDLTVFVQNLLEQMVNFRNIMNVEEAEEDFLVSS